MKFISSVFGLFSGGSVLAYAGIAAGLVACAGTGWTVHKIDNARYESLQLTDAKNATAAVEQQAVAVATAKDKQIAEATTATAEAIAEAAAQDKVKQPVLTITKEITRYVTVKGDSVACVPYGVIRVLNAAVGDGLIAADPATLPDPTGQSDDACAPISASDFAQQLVADIGTAEQNAEQLNALEASIAELLKEANGDSK